MKFIHISDLHFGKSLFNYSMVEQGDQPFWVEEFFKLVDREHPQAILISGDVYDRAIPSKEAIRLLDGFMTRLVKLDLPVFMIAGNHDSGARLSFGSDIFKTSKLYIAGEVKKEIEHFTLNDEYGPVNFWLLPYFYPAAVRELFNDDSINGFQQALEKLLEGQDIDYSQRNVILSHQTVMNGLDKPEYDGSETAIGGVDGVDVSAYEKFDYVALGHIHAAQKVKSENIRYAGSPLCYHFGELRKANKGPVIVELKNKGEFSYRIEYLPVLHPLREIKGKLEDVLRAETVNSNEGEYIRVVLTDEKLPARSRTALQELFERKNSILMEMVYQPENVIANKNSEKEFVEEASMDEMFINFYMNHNNGDNPDEKSQDIIKFISEQIMNENDLDASERDKQIDKIIEFALKQED